MITSARTLWFAATLVAPGETKTLTLKRPDGFVPSELFIPTVVASDRFEILNVTQTERLISIRVRNIDAPTTLRYLERKWWHRLLLRYPKVEEPNKPRRFIAAFRGTLRDDEELQL